VSRVPAVSGEIGFALTSIRPGTIGDEFFMTRGHVHERPEGEVYFCLSGAGGVLLRRDASVRWIEMAPQHVVSIPPGWAHRTVNVGSDPFRFLAAYPADLSNDYRSVRVAGIGARVVRSGPEYRVLDDDGGELPSHGA